MGVAMDQLLVILLAASVAAQDYGPVSLDSVDALTLNWNQIQWLVKDQIKEVEELREEHNELYNEITRCFGNEKCLAEFELLDMSPGSKLHGLGLRALDLSGSAMSRMREEVLKTKARLDLEMRERWTMDKKVKEDQARLAAQEEALAAAEAKRVSSDFFKGRLLVIFIIVVHLLLLLFSRLWRFTGSRSDVLWPQLANQQRRVSFLQREHHFWSNAYCLRAQVQIQPVVSQ